MFLATKIVLHDHFLPSLSLKACSDRDHRQLPRVVQTMKLMQSSEPCDTVGNTLLVKSS